MSRSLYEVLGVAPDASLDTIKSAYRSQVRDCHPDRHPSDPTARARFEALTQAYKVLSDAKRRKKYDDAQTPSLSPGTASEGEALLTGLASWLGKAASEQVERRIGGSGLPRRLARELAKTAVDEVRDSVTGKVRTLFDARKR